MYCKKLGERRGKSIRINHNLLKLQQWIKMFEDSWEHIICHCLREWMGFSSVRLCVLEALSAVYIELIFPLLSHWSPSNPQPFRWLWKKKFITKFLGRNKLPIFPSLQIDFSILRVLDGNVSLNTPYFMTWRLDGGRKKKWELLLKIIERILNLQFSDSRKKLLGNFNF
jgi:hypothetical protein